MEDSNWFCHPPTSAVIVRGGADLVAAHADARARHVRDVEALVRSHGGAFAAAGAGDTFESVVVAALFGRSGTRT